MQLLFNQATENLRKYWGYSEFRNGQDVAVRSVLEGKETLVLFPTGGGKSLCYQVPATVFEGLTLVISPLVALMQDQVQQLKDRGISATFINSTLPGYEVEQRLVNARNGMYKLLYCAPERLSSPRFQAELPNLAIECVAVDEAHCISEWGHDFRPAYRTIRKALAGLPDTTRWMALTATATPEVQADILTNLKFTSPEIVTAGFERPNLIWWVIHTEDKRSKLLRAVKRLATKGDGLIYAGTRKNCEFWANTLSRQGIKTEAYHAGMKAEDRKAIQQRWISGDTPLVAATNAFGMGVDKPNCRYVLHEEMPYSLEAYYQEAGRAGRDGAESYPMLFYRESDYFNLRKRLEQNYPTYAELERVYNSLCDELGLAVGSLQPEMQSFQYQRLVTRSSVPLPTVRAAMRLLNQFGVISMLNDMPPRIFVQFTVSRALLGEFKQSCGNPNKAEFLDKIERLYGPAAYHDYVPLEEKMVLDKLRISRNGLVKALNVLMQHDQLLVFSEDTGQHLVRLLEPRTHYLPISKPEVEAYRKTLLEKLDWMHGYATTDTCREVYLLKYFGQTDAKPCGKCDNCTRQRSTYSVKDEDVGTLYQLLIQQGESLEQIQTQLNWSQKRITATLNHLIKENVIELDPERPGHYCLKK